MHLRAWKRSSRILCLALGLLSVASCSAVRRLSQVETREPASEAVEAGMTSLRARMLSFQSFPKSCPPELREILPGLSQEKVKFPPCPPSLQPSYEASKAILTTPERSLVEELINSQCRTLLDSSFGSSPLEGIVEGLLPKDGKKADNENDEEEATPLSEQDLLRRIKLRESLIEVRNLHSPLEQWIRVNGDYAIPEEELEFVERLISQNHCRMSDQEVDQSYRTIHSLEALARIQAENEPQRDRLLRLLGGVHRIIDRKIREYFQP